MRLIWIFLGLAVLLMIPFLLWAERLDFGTDGAVDWMQGFGAWAWAAGVALLVSDLFLPIPGTAVMAGLGFIYGPILGGLISAIGSFLSGTVAYLLCRLTGRRGALWLVGERDLSRGEEVFTKIGGWLVAVSRWLPLFPEVIACMAGLVRMPPRLFFTALACGAIPLGFTYAMVGAAGSSNPALAIGLSACLPPVLWLLLNRWITARVRSSSRKDSSVDDDGDFE
ncbi:MAG: TVP38/TMEM64 family protein [Limisphaerales bacterium]